MSRESRNSDADDTMKRQHKEFYGRSSNVACEAKTVKDGVEMATPSHIQRPSRGKRQRKDPYRTAFELNLEDREAEHCRNDFGLLEKKNSNRQLNRW